MSQAASIVGSLVGALLALGLAGAALAAPPASSRAQEIPHAAARRPSHGVLASDERTARDASSHARVKHRQAGLQAAKAGTGASAVAAEKSEHMPVPRTGM
jgi:hypothetical protein